MRHARNRCLPLPAFNLVLLVISGYGFVNHEFSRVMSAAEPDNCLWGCWRVEKMGKMVGCRGRVRNTQLMHVGRGRACQYFVELTRMCGGHAKGSPNLVQSLRRALLLTSCCPMPCPSLSLGSMPSIFPRTIHFDSYLFRITVRERLTMFVVSSCRHPQKVSLGSCTEYERACTRLEWKDDDIVLRSSDRSLIFRCSLRL
jgi:hypothetical protein